MRKELKLKFAKALNNLEGEGYLRSMIAFASAPTIEGKKPSSLMIFNKRGKNTFKLWEKYGMGICKEFMLEQFVLKKCKNSLTVLLYRKELLEEYLNEERNKRFLVEMGYEYCDCLKNKLLTLKHRFKGICPHEVGVFLGIPVEDVEGFIYHKGNNCIICRYWKVYGDEKKARLIFETYDKARERIVEEIINSALISGLPA
jgi:hypothetical protein